ncbi:MAG: hypothetical protein GF317_07150 [Candidatus Lokiarchaeota archaeon]|nr:hypothetical protein [Candidatus Lokiarchaeota archaeon]MBD3199485.1 hypothetical protein [Candidatus Lokiarchaeota archaeon]
MEHRESPETFKNLLKCYFHESNVRCLYEIYSKRAIREGESLISKFFNNIAQQKQQYVYWIILMLNQFQNWNENTPSMDIIENNPKVGKTIENLEVAFEIQDYEWRKLFFNMPDTAKEEGYNEIASRLKIITDNERRFFEHCKIFLNFYEDGILNKEKNLSIYECQSCGFQIYNLDLPDDWVCPICGHMKTYFQKKTLNLETDKEMIWECMECGEEVVIQELPENWKCINCGRSREYFRKRGSKTSSITSIDFSTPTWICMECGNEVDIEDLPKNWRCISCGKPKSYFKRKPKSKMSKSQIKLSQEKAIWFCSSCGSEIEVNLPNTWKCPICGSRGK